MLCGTPRDGEVIEGVLPEQVDILGRATILLSRASDSRSSPCSSSRTRRLPNAVSETRGMTAPDGDGEGATGSEMGAWTSAGDTVVVGDDAAEQASKYCGLPEDAIESGEVVAECGDFEEMAPKRGTTEVACIVSATAPPPTIFAPCIPDSSACVVITMPGIEAPDISVEFVRVRCV